MKWSGRRQSDNMEDRRGMSAYSDETVHPIPGQTEQLFL